MNKWIVFRQYHRGENQSGDLPGIVRTIWDDSLDAGIYQDIELPIEWQKLIYEARQIGYWNEKQGDIEFPVFDNTVGETREGIDVNLWYAWDEATATPKFEEWLRKVVDEAGSVGGDDSYFDYYPDQFYIADQVGEALGRQDLVQAAKEAVYAQGLYHDEDVIGHGQPLDDSYTGIRGGIG